MEQLLATTDDPEIEQLIDETLEGLQSMNANGLKCIMQLGEMLFKKAKERLEEMEGRVSDGA